MLLYYLKYAWRHLLKSLNYSIINIIGLALGIASVLLIFLYTQYEFSFDDYDVKEERIYRLVEYDKGETRGSAWLENDIANKMRTSFTGVEDAVKLRRPQLCGVEITVRGQTYTDVYIRCTESNFFNIFTVPLIAGNGENILDEPNTAVISKSLAKKVYGTIDVVGKTFETTFPINVKKTITIKGIMENIPKKTHFKADILISYNSQSEHWKRQAHIIYVLLKEDAKKDIIGKQALKYLHTTPGQASLRKITLQPLRDVYFGSVYAQKQGNINYVYILSAIAFLILIIGCANYMNLATARYSKRSKEIGMRKILGAYRKQLVGQFLLETILLTLLALPIAFLLIMFALPYFNFYVGTSLSFNAVYQPGFYFTVVGIIGFTGLLAGAYPAFVSTAVPPGEVIAGAGTTRRSFTGNRFRKGLVGFQFLITIVLIALTVVMIQQVHFVQNKDLGYRTDDIVSVSLGIPLRTKYDVLKREFEQIPTVQNATAAAMPGTPYFAGISIGFRPSPTASEEIELQTQEIDNDFIEMMNIPLIAGRNISANPSDTALVIAALINETAVSALDFENPQAAVGQTIASQYRIVGVVQNFHYQNLKKEIKPLLLTQIDQTASSISVLFKGDDFYENIEALRSIWTEIAGNTNSFNYTILENQLQQQYGQEERAAKVIGIFALISIFIACLGLFGLSAYTAQQRRKEIGIRKVMGAQTGSIILLLYKDFGRIAFIATLIAIPIILFAGGKWLQNFAYRMNIGPVVVLLPLLIVIFILILSTGSHAIKAALMNPVDSIRNE